MPVPVCSGTVEGGAFVPDFPARYDAHLSDLEGKRVEVIVRKPKSQRSLDQNAYIHAVPIRILAEHFGYFEDEMKYVLLGECFGWWADPVSGREIPRKAHTSDLSVEECRQFIDWLLPWAATEHGVILPAPGEVDV